MKKLCRALLPPLALLMMTGCIPCPSRDAASTMTPLADALTKLSPKVESVVRYGNPPENSTSSDLLALATQSDPGLLQLFNGYEVRAFAHDRHASVMVCTIDGKRGLLEDLGCSAMLDRNLWIEQTLMPCSFTLSATLGCEAKK